MEVGQHKEDAVSHPRARSPLFLWSFGLVLLCSVPSFARMAPGVDGASCQLAGKAGSLCLGSCLWALLWGNEALGMYNGAVLRIAVR